MREPCWGRRLSSGKKKTVRPSVTHKCIYIPASGPRDSPVVRRRLSPQGKRNVVMVISGSNRNHWYLTRHIKEQGGDTFSQKEYYSTYYGCEEIYWDTYGVIHKFYISNMCILYYRNMGGKIGWKGKELLVG